MWFRNELSSLVKVSLYSLDIMHSQTKLIFVDLQRLTLITILWQEKTAHILWGPKDKTTEVSILLEYGTVSMGVQWPKFLEHYTVSKYGILISHWKVIYTLQKSKNSDKIFPYHPPMKQIRREFWKQAGALSGVQQLEYGMSPDGTRHDSAGRFIYLWAASLPYYG